MSSKNQVLKLIDQFSETIIKKLQISQCNITWHVVHSKDKDLKKKGLLYPDSVALCIWDHKKKRNNAYDIIIYHDLQRGTKDIKGSIFHELLHVRLRQWDRLIKKTSYSNTRHHSIEEDLVRTLEQLYIDLL